jgi:hypothetical protein
MRWSATVALVSLALATTACLDTTEPIPLIDGRVVHAIPGVGPAVVSVDGAPTLQLPSLQFAYFVVTAAPRTYDFALDDLILSLRVQHDRDITAIVLLDLDGPTLRAYHLDRNGPEQRIAVINAHAAAATLAVAIDGPDRSFALTVAPGEAQTFDPPAGPFSIRVRGEGDEDSYELPPFELEVGDYGFLVIAPGTTPAQRYVRLLF